MNDERSASWSVPERTGDIRRKGQRVSPSETLKHPNGKMAAEDGMFVWIVVSDRRDATQQILQTTPPEPYRLGYPKLGRNRIFGWPEKIIGPGCRIRILTAPKPREQIELQVVMGVHEARQYHVTA